MRLIRKRIVTDVYCGYEVQVWRLWWPFWTQENGCNTFGTIEAAEKYARKGCVVKEVDLGGV